MLRAQGPRSPDKWSTARVHALLWNSAAAVSSRLSIAVVLGFAVLPLIPHQRAPATTASIPKPTPKVEMVAARSMPVIARNERVVEPKATPQTILPEPAPQKMEAPAATDQAGEDQAAGDVQPSDRLVQLAAAQSRSRRSKQEQAKKQVNEDARRVTSGIAMAEPMRTSSGIASAQPERRTSGIATEQPAGRVPVPSKDEETAKTTEAEPPEPDEWSNEQVIAALKDCLRVLGPIAAEVEVAPPVKQDQCGTPAPVMLKRVGSGANKVEISPPAMLNCQMVAGLHAWVEKSLQPAAMEAFGSPVTRLRNASGYSCRNRNGTLRNADKLSEHAKANAVDIAGFITADGRTVDLTRHWGPTERDVREAERVATQRAKEAKEAEAKADEAKAVKAEPAKAEPTRIESSIATKGALPKGGRREADKREEARPKTVSADPKAVPLPSSRSAEEERRETTEARFLRRLHAGACGVFGTVLGPEANEAHRDHFHFDMAERRRRAYCE